ncbi:MAG: hypothetical protein ABIU05_24180, partial [Nitrospirales bacterium]
TFNNCWDDLISLAMLASGADLLASDKKVKNEQTVSVRLAQLTTYQDASGRKHEPGSVLELPASHAVALVRGGSAAYVSQPPVVTRERETSATKLNRWEYAATWPAKAGGDMEYQGCVRELRATHEQIRNAIGGYLAGGEPIISLKEVDFKLGPSPLTPISPLTAVRCTEAGVEISGIEGPVLVQFLKVFSEVGQYFHRCHKCNATFLAERTDRRFCSDSCRAIFSMRKLRAKNKEDAQRVKEAAAKRKGRTSSSKSKQKAIHKGGKRHGKNR